ncbi:CAP domain-containing protein [Streptomyces sp. NPDC000229]|uniref:CAP domain-containing protein n=1 Tax=Streptomyces sp. NPDC000229 TaxID=3154247 RepID=UPI00331BE742
MQHQPHQDDPGAGGDRAGPKRPVRPAERGHAPWRTRAHRGAGTVIAGTVAAAAVATAILITGNTGRHPGATTRTGTTLPTSVPASAPDRAERAAPTEPEPGGGENTPRAGGAQAPGIATGYAERVVALVNAERARAGCSPLRRNGRLRSSAQGHADDMAARDYYAHNSPEGRDAGDRMEAAGYNWRTWGENIHRGPKDPARAVRDWMGSAGHRKNIVNCEFKDIGVGVNLRSNGPWWVQNFGVVG